MRLLVGVPRDLEVASLVGAFAELHAEPVVVSLDDGGWTEREGPADQAALIHPHAGVVAVGELVGQWRQRLGEGKPLLVACQQLRPVDRRAVMRCGATSLVSPANWRGVAIAERVVAELIEAGQVVPSSLGSIQGATPPMQRLYRDIETFARLDDPVLVLGETGSGKELVARELHRCSGRPGALLAINCAALTPELLESELFGHERGAFSGAVSARRGLLLEAGPGTVFLDEIGDLAPGSQAKLLRVLEERKVRPVGGNRWQSVEARIVLATHRDLAAAVRGGNFRQDLHERIRGFTVELPPLRERKADLVLLCHQFLAEYNRDYHGARTIPAGALDPLFRHSWPGNVRELRQAMRRAAAFADGDDGPISAISLVDMAKRAPVAGASHSIPFDPAVDTWDSVEERAKAHYFKAVLRDSGGNKPVAIKRSGVGRSQFYEIIRQLSLAEANDPAGDTDE